MFWVYPLAAVLAGPPSQADLDACATAQTDNDFASWQGYLAAHPDGICAHAPAAADVADCIAARASGEVELWGAYAALHPRGFCITEAKGALHAEGDADEQAQPMPPRTRVGGAETATGPTTSLGPLSVEAVTAALEPFQDPLQGCGEGVARIHLAVLASGALAEIEVEGVDEAVAACVTEALATHLAFPATDGPTRIVHRLSLGASE